MNTMTEDTEKLSVQLSIEDTPWMGIVTDSHETIAEKLREIADETDENSTERKLRTIADESDKVAASINRIAGENND